MNAPRLALREIQPAILFSRFTTNSTNSSSRSCQHLLRQFSHSQRAYFATEKLESAPSFHPYPLSSRPSPSPRNDTSSDTSISKAVPEVHETRPPPSQPIFQTRPQSSTTEPTPTPAVTPTANAASIPESEAQKTKAAPKRRFKARKAALKLTAPAVAQLRNLLQQPEPKLIKVGVRNRGCSGLAYHLEYVDKPGMFDEEVEQDGVKVLIDSKALFSIIGSEMDWQEDKLNQRFVFKNPNIKEECGCGESFMV